MGPRTYRSLYVTLITSIGILGFGWFLMPSEEEKRKKIESYGRYSYKKSIEENRKVENRPKTKDELIMDVLRNAAESKDPIYRPKPK